LDERENDHVPDLEELMDLEDRRISKLSQSEMDWINDMAQESKFQWSSQFDISD
jgi:hypothetical protein